MRRTGYRLFSLLAMLWLAGCYEDPGVTFYEAGQYKGRSDPLLATQAEAGQHERLVERLRTVQMDR